MKKSVYAAGLLGCVLLMGTIVCHAENWVKNDFQNKTVESNFHDSDSVKVQDKTLNWTEKNVFTSSGSKNRTKHLSQYPVCKQNISKKGDVTQYQADYQIEKGKFRRVAIRNYNKKNELICTDKDMGTELDKSWHRIGRRSPMEETYYNLVTKYKLGDI